MTRRNLLIEVDDEDLELVRKWLQGVDLNPEVRNAVGRLAAEVIFVANEADHP